MPARLGFCAMLLSIPAHPQARTEIAKIRSLDVESLRLKLPGRVIARYVTAAIAIVTWAWLVAPASGQPSPAAPAPDAIAPARDETAAIEGKLGPGSRECGFFSVRLTVPKGVDLHDPTDDKAKVSSEKVADLINRHQPSRVIQDMKFSYDADTRVLQINYTVAGFARGLGGGKWETSLSNLPVHKEYHAGVEPAAWAGSQAWPRRSRGAWRRHGVRRRRLAGLLLQPTARTSRQRTGNSHSTFRPAKNPRRARAARRSRSR